jgi:hypothetical protein
MYGNYPSVKRDLTRAQQYENSSYFFTAIEMRKQALDASRRLDWLLRVGHVTY